MTSQPPPPADDTAGGEGASAGGPGGEPKPEKNKGGRPSKIHDEALVSKLVRGLLRGLPPELACDRAGLARSTYYEWLKQGEADAEADLDTPHARFSDRVKRALAETLYRLLGRVRKGAEGWQGAAWVAERRYREHCARPTAIEVSGPGGKPVQIDAKHHVDVSKLPLDELERIVRGEPSPSG